MTESTAAQQDPKPPKGDRGIADTYYSLAELINGGESANS